MMRCTPFQVLISSWIGHFVLGPRLEAPADADVEPLGVLSKDDEVDVFGAPALERTEALVEQRDRAVVDVEIELEARAEQDVARVAVVGHARIAQRTDEDRVEPAKQIVAVRRHRDACLEVVVGAPGQAFDVEAAAESRLPASSTFTASAVTSLPIPSPGDHRDAHGSPSALARNALILPSSRKPSDARVIDLI